MAFNNGPVHPSRMLNLNPAFASNKVIDLTNGFDFGSGQAVPWTIDVTGDGLLREQQQLQGQGAPRSYNVGPPSRGSPFRSFSRSADVSLLDYLRSRNISPYFLSEIDQFLAAHPEIAQHRPHFSQQINHATPLEAYRFFIKGYTKPARYVEGVLPDLFNIPLPDTIMPVAPIYDEELATFFSGYEYRYDILDKIDHEVARLASALYHGEKVTFGERKLVAYALFANVVDTYKYYEYNYQKDWLAHRYLPEHVVLSELPKQPGYTEPIPRQITYDDDCPEMMRSHPGTRARMARACDAGVDVIEVLLEDFTAALCRQGLRRTEIEQMRRDAVRNIDHQRTTQGGRDIVDMVMDRASRAHPEDFGRAAPKRTTGRQHRIQSLKHALKRLWMQEAGSQEQLPDFVEGPIRKMRMRVERELVFEVTQLALDAGTMTQRAVNNWRNKFSKKAHVEREAAGRFIDVFEELGRYM